MFIDNIKVSELEEIGHKIKKILVPELNEIQSEMIKIEDIMKMELQKSKKISIKAL